MLMKNLMKEIGIFNDDTKVISCPSCGCKSIYESGHILAHDSDCAFLKACVHLNVNPYDYSDGRVMNWLEVKDMFEKSKEE